MKALNVSEKEVAMMMNRMVRRLIAGFMILVMAFTVPAVHVLHPQKKSGTGFRTG